MAHMGHSKPDSGLGFQVKVLKACHGVVFLLGSGGVSRLVGWALAAGNPESRNLKSETWNPEPDTRNSGIPKPKSGTRNQKPEIWDPKT